MKSAYIFLFFFLLINSIIEKNIEAQSGWTLLNSGSTDNLKAVCLLDYESVFVTGDGARVLRSDDSGTNWLDISPAFSSVNLNGIVFFDSLTGIVVGDAGNIYRTINGGADWSTVASGVPDNLLSVSFVDSFGICGALSQTIIYSMNSGISWTTAQSGFFGGGFWGAYMLSPDIGYVIGENSIFQPLLGTTADGGVNWTFSSFYLNNNEGRAYDVIFTDNQIGYAACAVWDGRGAIAKTTDSGTSWSTMFFNTPLYGINFPISNASLVGYAVGISGTILKTTDAGTNWQPQVSGTSEVLNDVFFMDLDYGFAVGNGGIILKTETGGEPPIQITHNKNRNLSGFELIGNYPNPFNSGTIIRFNLFDGSKVNLKIFNILGEEIATLVSDRLSAGSYSYEWDANSMASGVYLYRLQAGNYVETRKMVLMR